MGQELASPTVVRGPDAGRTVATHCPYCALQCGIELQVTPRAGDGRPDVRVAAADFPTNRGGLCAKGWSAADLLQHPDRLTSPLVRSVPGDRTSPLRAGTWDEALDAVAEAVRSTQRRHGRDAVGCFGGGGLTNEKAYLLGKFARTVLRTRSIDYNGRWCMSSAAAAATRTFGIDRGLPFPVTDLALADVLLLVGANPAETMPPLVQHLEAGRARGARHVVVDPRKTATARTAHLHLQPRPGTDAALANGLLHLVVRGGWVDEDYVAARTVGFETVRESVAGYWPDRVERITGVPARDLEGVAELLATASTAMVLTARGAEQHASGTATAQAFVNLSLALGLPGRRGSGYGTITGQGNGQGGREHGQKADQLPGYRKLTDPAHRAHVAAVWGVDPTRLPGPGVSATEMLRAMGTPGGVRTLLLLASNVAVSAPDAGAVTDRLDALDFLVVGDLFLSETAAQADVVLPVAMWAEEDGTTTNLEGRVLRRRRALDPPPGVRTDLDVLSGIADRLGHGHLMTTDPAAAFEELGRASAGGVADYAGITYARIEDEQGVFWPCADPDDPGTPRLFAHRFAHPDGLARFYRAEYREPAERTDPEFPYVLTTGRLMRQYQSGTQTRRVAALAGDEVGPDGTVLPHAELHPDLARRCGVVDGEPVQLRTRRGTAVFRARVTPDIRSDTVFVPFHWSGASRANSLTHAALDPVSRMPAFKACAVAVAPLPAAPPTPAPQAGTTTGRTRAPWPPARPKGLALDSHPTFLQGVYALTGKGLAAPALLDVSLSYTVPDGAVAQTVYFRGGNSADELIVVVLVRDGTPMRYFPIGAKGDVHVPLRVVEDLEPGTTLEVHAAGAAGVSGVVIVDLGLVEV
ncbi:molybdopterin oxidoreductase family protein [Cellulomonas sp. URHB0016]